MTEIEKLIAAMTLRDKKIDDLVDALGDTPRGGGGRGSGSGGYTPPSGGTSISVPTPGGIPNPISMNNTRMGLDKLTQSLAAVKTLGGASVQVLDELGTYGKDKYDPLQRAFGGLGNGLNSVNETSREVVGAIDNIYAAYYANDDAQLDFMVTRNGQRVNAMYTFFGSAEEVANNYLRVRENLAGRQSIMLNKMTEEDQTQLGMFSKGLRLTNREVAEVMERQISLNGEASNEIFLNISKFAKATSDATGTSFQEISAGIVDIITDVETFGNVSEEQAARIAANLSQIGLSTRGFGQMVDKFMNFDTAAESLGNLSTVFGVHFDAMEMMMLSSTDPEEFLHRMRESFLDAGMEIEDMTLPEKKLAAQQLGMSITEFENFMQEGREMTDLARETDDAKRLDGFQTMVDQMAIEGKSLEDMTEHLQRKVFDSLSHGAYKVGNEFETMKGRLVLEPEKYLPGYEQYFHTVSESMKAVAGDRTQYENLYDGVVVALQSQEGLNDETAEYLALLRETKTELSSVSMIELALQFPDVSAQIMASSAGITAAGAEIGKEIGDGIESGLTIDEATTRAEIDKKLKIVGGELNSGALGGLKGQSPSPAIGIPLMFGIIHGVTDLMTYPGNKKLLDTGLASFGDYVSTSLSTSVAANANPLIAALAEGESEVTISSTGVISDIVEQLRISQGKSDEVITKIKTEEAENLKIVSEALQANALAVKAVSEKATTADISVNLDTGTLVRALQTWKGSDGTFIKFVVPK